MNAQRQIRAKASSIPSFSFTPTYAGRLQRTCTSSCASSPTAEHDDDHVMVLAPQRTPLGHNFGQIQVYRSASRSFLPKLAISQPGDKYEQEADWVAEQVMRMSEPQLQRQAAAEEEEEEEELLQAKQLSPRQVETGIAPPAETPAIVQGVLRSPGRPLDPSTRQFMESRFGHDFGHVRVHTDERAAQSARAVNALAYTVGRDIAFGAGEYAPATAAGRRLLAHELTHILQQDGRKYQTQALTEVRSSPNEPEIPLRISNVAPFVSPYLQRLRIATLSQSKGRCGRRSVKWHFTLDRKAPANGFLVQEIDANSEVHDAAGNVIPGPVAHFWEAWKVNAGYRRAEIAENLRFTDESERHNIPRSRGVDVSYGNVRFYLEEDPINPGAPPAGPYTGPLDLNWPVGGHPASGQLHSTPAPPAFWAFPPEEGSEERRAISHWDCVNPNRKSRFSNLYVKP